MARRDWEKEKPKENQKNTIVWINKKNGNVIGIWKGYNEKNWYLDTPLQQDVKYQNKEMALRAARAYMRSH